jgi:hypothetical protein
VNEAFDPLDYSSNTPASQTPFQFQMSQFPHDRFNKNLFELHLSPFGEINTQRPMDPETTFIDIYFVPRLPIPLEPPLGLLA